MHLKCHFWGSLPSNDYATGGGEYGNARTLSLYRDIGILTKVTQKPRKTGGPIVYLWKCFCSTLYYTARTLRNDRSFVHVVGFARNIILFDIALILIARVAGKKVIYELRGGQHQDHNQKSGVVYGLFFRIMITLPHVILVQTRADANFVGRMLNADANRVIHFPNFTQAGSDPSSNPPTSSDLGIIYFGRICKDKGLIESLDLLLLLLSMNPNWKFHIIGNVDPKFYFEFDQKLRSSSLLSHAVLLHGHLQQHQIHEIAKHCHFFILLSSNPIEGQSNSLTEAMALGLVPVCSDIGAARDLTQGVIEMIDMGLTPVHSAYNIITRYLDPAKWIQVSCAARSRINSQFRAVHAKEALCKSMAILLKS